MVTCEQCGEGISLDCGIRHCHDSLPFCSEQCVSDYREAVRVAERQDWEERSDIDQENPQKYSEDFDWSIHDWDSDPDWR